MSGTAESYQRNFYFFSMTWNWTLFFSVFIFFNEILPMDLQRCRCMSRRRTPVARTRRRMSRCRETLAVAMAMPFLPCCFSSKSLTIPPKIQNPPSSVGGDDLKREGGRAGESCLAGPQLPPSARLSTRGGGSSAHKLFTPTLTSLSSLFMG